MAFGSTVLSLWLPVRDTDEAAIEAGAIPDIFRVRVPHAAQGGEELTQLQKDVIKLADTNVRELHLIINKKKPYHKSSSHLNSLSKEISTMYNEWAEDDADGDSMEDDDEEDEEDDDEDDDKEEDEEDEDEEDDKENVPPPAKKARPAAAEYAIPSVTSLKDATGLALASHLNVSRPNGEPQRVEPYIGSANEHFVVVYITQDDPNDN